MKVKKAYQQTQSTEQLIRDSKVIGYGLQDQICRLEMSRVQGTGVFWQHKEGASGTGIWCSQQQWQSGVLESCMLPDPILLNAELAACVTADLLEPAGIWLAQSVQSVPVLRQLAEGIYPQLTIGNFTCFLIDWPWEQWHREVELWTPYQGESPLVSARLLAGFVGQDSAKPCLPPLHGGMWLEGELYPEAGEGLLWWGRPLAKIVLEHQEEASCLTVIEPWPEISFHFPPLLVELGRVDIELAQLSRLSAGETIGGAAIDSEIMDGEELDGEETGREETDGEELVGEEIAISVSLNSNILIYHSNTVIATGHLLRGREELLVQISSSSL